MKVGVKFSRIVLIILILQGLHAAAGAADNRPGDIRAYGRKAFAAATARDAEVLLPDALYWLSRYPGHPVLHYTAARLLALAHNQKDALQHLDSAVRLGYGLEMLGYPRDISNDPAFLSIRSLARFQHIRENVRQLEKPVESGRLAWTVAGGSLLPEGITHDVETGCFFLGSESAGKIVRTDDEGRVSDFFRLPDSLQGMILGLKVDAVRRHLWGCVVNNDGQPYRAPVTRAGWTAVVKLDADSGALLKSYRIPQVRERHEFNDLTVHANGDVYISDSQAGAVYRISHDSDSLQCWLSASEICSPNGITLSDDGRSLYLADWVLGIFKIDIETHNLIFMTSAAGIALCGIDGLYFWRGSLLAVQNGLDRVVRYELNEQHHHIERMTVLDANTSLMNMPTTGVPVGDAFFYIAGRRVKDLKIKNKNLADSAGQVSIVKINLKQQE